MKLAILVLCPCLLLPACAGYPPHPGDTRAGAGIHLNQVGFLPHAPKLAVLPAAETEPRSWQLLDASGVVLAEGTTRVYGDDPVSGQHVHRIDFSGHTGARTGLRLRSGSAASHAFEVGDDVYRPLKYDALRYFYHNRSGVEIAPLYAGGAAWARPAAHEAETVTCRSGKDDDGNVWPGCDYTLDVTGGWYDAGDHGKYVVNGGISVWTLVNLYERQRARGRIALGDAAGIPESGNGLDDVLDEARFELEFLLRMQAPEGAAAQVPVGVKRSEPGLEFRTIDASGMAHHKIADANWTALPMPPHLSREERYLFPVSTAATLNLAATAAQCARVWRELDADFADRCLAAARRAWTAARRNPEVYAIANFAGSGGYGDGELADEFFWAAAELYATTGDAAYREALEASPHYAAPLSAEPGWPRVAPLGAMTLALGTGKVTAEEAERQRARLVAAADRFRNERTATGYRIPYGATRYPWGSNSNILNRAIVLALAHDFTGNTDYRDAAIDAMDYILGRNPLDRSYVSGYGARPFERPHHRFWARSLDSDLPPPPPGALSGGPNTTSAIDEVGQQIAGACAPQTCWRDDVRAYSLNEVAINWNAPLVWVATYLGDAPR